MSDAAWPATFHVMCPLCGEEIGGGPLRRDTDWPLDLLQAEIISEAWEHCYDRHTEATGVVLFHVESHVVEYGAEHAQRPRVKSIHLDWELPIPLPVPPES